jgi:ribosomal protein S18 acetylase RimI-like enzyme
MYNDAAHRAPSLTLRLAKNHTMSKRNGNTLKLEWRFSQDSVDWDELSNLFKIAPLGEKAPDELQQVFSNSMYKCFIFDQEKLVGVGRALADGVDCSYICDVAVLPSHQGTGIGKSIVSKLVELSAGHKKIILYACPGKEPFYKKLGFKRMSTAMAIFENQSEALKSGLVNES